MDILVVLLYLRIRAIILVVSPSSQSPLPGLPLQQPTAMNSHLPTGT